LHSTATIVLPVHNRERTLRPEVLRILDLAEVLHRRVVIAIVDDGSRDGTFETACELAREFPQIRVLRQPHQGGLGGALEQVRTRLGAEQVVAHDGVTAIDLDELAQLLSATEQPRPMAMPAPRETATEASGSRRFAAPMAHPARQAVAARVLGSFRWLRLDEPVKPRRSRAAHPPVSAAIGGLMASAGDRPGLFTTPAPYAN
jgi:hypothetical protein